jgi:hypothetical protein
MMIVGDPTEPGAIVNDGVRSGREGLFRLRMRERVALSSCILIAHSFRGSCWCSQLCLAVSFEGELGSHQEEAQGRQDPCVRGGCGCVDAAWSFSGQRRRAAARLRRQGVLGAHFRCQRVLRRVLLSRCHGCAQSHGAVRRQAAGRGSVHHQSTPTLLSAVEQAVAGGARRRKRQLLLPRSLRAVCRPSCHSKHPPCLHSLAHAVHSSSVHALCICQCCFCQRRF